MSCAARRSIQGWRSRPLFSEKRGLIRGEWVRPTVRHYLASTPQFHSWKNVWLSLVLPENSSGMRSLLLDTINLSFEFFLAYFSPDQCNTVCESFHINHIRHGAGVSPVKITATDVDVAMLRSRLWAVQIWRELPKTIYNNKHLYPKS